MCTHRRSWLSSLFRCCCGRNIRTTSLQPGVATIISLLYFCLPSRRVVHRKPLTGERETPRPSKGKTCMEALLLFCSAPLLRAPIDITVVIHGQLTRCASPLFSCPAQHQKSRVQQRRWMTMVDGPIDGAMAEEEGSHSPQAGQGPCQAPPVPPATAGQRLARTHACLTPATAHCMHGIHLHGR